MTSATGLWIANALVNFGTLAIIATGLNITFGMAGIFDLAYIVWVACGAYVGGVAVLGPSDAALQLNHILGLSLPWPVAIVLGGIAAAGLGSLVGLVALRRLRSDYLAIVMIAVWSITFDLVNNDQGLFNGPVGLFNVPQPFSSLTGSAYYSWLFLGIVTVVLILLTLTALGLERSAFGRTLRAIRDDDMLAEAVGKRVMATRMRALAISSAYGGVAGALTCLYLSSYNPSAWGVFETVGAFTAILLGGRGNVLGALAGAFVISAIADGLQLMPTINGGLELSAYIREFAFAALLCGVLLVRPAGIFPERIGLRSKTAEDAGVGEGPPLPAVIESEAREHA